MSHLRRNTSNLTRLTPENAQPPCAICNALRAEIAFLKSQNKAQSYALAHLNQTIRFAVTTLGQPLKPMQTCKPAKKGKI